MSVPLVPLAASVAMALVGVLVLVARGPGKATMVLAAMLFLWGAGSVANAVLIPTPDPQTAQVAAHLSVWYSLALPPLLLATAFLVIDGAWPRGRALIPLAVLTAFAVAALAAFLVVPRWLVAAIVPFGEGHAIASGPLLYAHSAAMVTAQGGVAAFAAYRATDASVALIARQRALLVTFAVAILAVHAAGFFVVFVALDPTVWSQTLVWVRIVMTLLAGAVSVLALAVAAAGASKHGRRLGLLVAAFAILLGVLDGIVRMGRLEGLAYPGYDTSLVLVRASFAGLLGLAVLRFGLAHAGTRGRRLVERAATFLAFAGVAGLAAGFGILVLGATAPSLLVAGVLAVATPAALRRHVASTGASLARRLLLPPDDPRAIAERARTYAAAVAASQGAGEEGARYLAELREDLGISAQEHELLVQGVASRERDRYRTVETLGRGATAQVQLAVDEVAGKRVVVKRFQGVRDPAAALQEARAIAAVKHPRVVAFLEVDRRGEDLFLVLAYAEGGSARQLLDREGPLAPARAVGLTCDLLEGLAALHAAELVHCDVKPENLLLDAQGRGMLGDFGSARFVAPDLADATLVGGGAEGSLSTISPEALRGAPPAPARDVYAAGALLYRLLTGEHYVDLADLTVFQARERILMDAPRLPHARVPIDLVPILRRALAKRPADRFASAQEMREALLKAAPNAPA